MLDDQVGISGVFVLTFCLIALYHLIGKIGPHGKRYNAPTKQVNKRAQGRRPDYFKKSSGTDDAWLLWTPDLEERADASKSSFGEHCDTNGLQDKAARIHKVDNRFTGGETK